VGWTGELQPIAITASSIASPDRGTNVVIAAPRGSIVELRDDIAPFDTVQADEGGARFAVHADGPFIARVSGSRAVAVRGDSSILRRVLVLGSAGWESKFTTAALEESGWKVDAMIRVAPGVDVSQSAGYHIDTARYSAVVALDESASPWADAIDEYARSGGGVIIGSAAAAKMPQALRVAPVGPAVMIPMTPSAVPVTLEKTPLSPLQSLPADAIVLRRRGEDVAVAARRYAAGRVIEIGYPESWRWRMAGDERAAEDHRQWWSGLVSAVAYAPRVSLPVAAADADNAPFAALVSAIGPPTSPELAAKQRAPASRSMAWLALLLSITLLSEITSRRLRGAK
jgi:hypothetical protein